MELRPLRPAPAGVPLPALPALSMPTAAVMPARLPPTRDRTSPPPAAHSPSLTPLLSSSLAVLIRIPPTRVRASSIDCRADASCESDDKTPREGAKHPRAKRKRTEETRKQEALVLRGELEDLEARLAELKKVNKLSGACSPRSTAAMSRPQLEGASRDLHLYLASLRCLLSQSIPEVAAPVHMYIHLERSMEHRRRTILELKPRQLRLGRQLIDQRSQFLDLTHPHVTNEWYSARDGNFCGLHFHVEQFRGVHSVPKAYAAAVGYTSDYKISVKKSVSVLKYHEDSLPPSSSSISQLRLVMAPPEGPAVEANTVLFAHYDEAENVGIIVANYVDKDDLRPYDPEKRIRQEVTAVLTLSNSPVGVVIRHWMYIRTCLSPHLLKPSELGLFARQNEGHKADDVIDYIRQQLAPPKKLEKPPPQTNKSRD